MLNYKDAIVTEYCHSIQPGKYGYRLQITCPDLIAVTWTNSAVCISVLRFELLSMSTPGIQPSLVM